MLGYLRDARSRKSKVHRNHEVLQSLVNYSKRIMNTMSSLAIAFASGAAFASVVVAIGLIHWNRQQSQLLWTSYLNNYAKDALRLSRGQQDEVLRAIEGRLPGVVHSVHSFGETPATRDALRRAKQFYDESGRNVPQEISGILSSPRL